MSRTDEPTDAQRPTDGPRLLEEHRRDIQALDRRILHLVCERLELARQIGLLKREHGVPLRNFEVEEEIHRRMADAGRLLGLDPALGRDLAVFLITKSVEEQASLLDAVYSGGQLETLVIGGKGGMGLWLARFLANQGHAVRVIDPAPGPSPFPTADTLAEGVAGAHVVFVAVPMRACAGVLSELADLGVTAVVAEMCSLKAHLRPTIDRVRRRGLRVVSFHPMFGPDVRMLSGRTVVFCTDADRGDVDLVRGFFAATSAELVELAPDEHDRRMAVVLGLTHLANLVFARAVTRSGVAPDALDEVAGVTFRKQLATTREVTRENPELYLQIQQLNPSTPDTGRWLAESLEELLAAVAGDEGVRFGQLMAEAARGLHTAPAVRREGGGQ